MKEFEQFKTKSLHSNAQKLPLFLPSGEKTDHFLMVIGADSDIMREAKARLMREAGLAMRNNEYDKKKEQLLSLEMIAHHIVDWSFKKECTLENVVSFLDDSPYIADAVDSFGAKHENFLQKK